MAIYLFLIGIIVVICILDLQFKMSQRIRNILFFSCVALIFLLSAFRSSSVGVDTRQYWSFYQTIDSRSSVFSTEFEIGFSLLVKVLHCVCKNPQLLLVVSSFLIVSSTSYFIKTNSKNIFLSLLLFVLYNYWFGCLNLMRQSLALSFILLGYNQLKKNTFKNDCYFLLSVLLACAFHKSAIIWIIVPFLRYIKITKQRLIGTSIAGVYIFAFTNVLFNIIVFIAPKYKYYLGSIFAENNYYGIFFKLLVSLSLLTFCYFFWDKFDSKCKFDKKFEVQTSFNNDRLLLNCFNLCPLVLYAALSKVILERVSSYLIAFGIVIVSNIVANLKDQRKKIYYVLIITMFFLYFVIIAIFRPNWDGCVPYKFFWSK